MNNEKNTHHVTINIPDDLVAAIASKVADTLREAGHGHADSEQQAVASSWDWASTFSEVVDKWCLDGLTTVVLALDKTGERWGDILLVESDGTSLWPMYSSDWVRSRELEESMSSATSGYQFICHLSGTVYPEVTPGDRVTIKDGPYACKTALCLRVDKGLDNPYLLRAQGTTGFGRYSREEFTLDYHNFLVPAAPDDLYRSKESGKVHFVKDDATYANAASFILDLRLADFLTSNPVKEFTASTWDEALKQPDGTVILFPNVTQSLAIAYLIDKGASYSFAHYGGLSATSICSHLDGFNEKCAPRRPYQEDGAGIVIRKGYSGKVRDL